MSSLTAHDVMNPDVRAVPVDMPVQDLAEFLVEEGISGVPVIDEDGGVLGVVSLTDIALHEALPEYSPVPETPHAFFRISAEHGVSEEDMLGFRMDDLGGTVTAGDIMTRDVYSVAPDTPVAEIASMMVKGQIHRVLVIRDGEVVGIISSLDLLDAGFPAD